MKRKDWMCCNFCDGAYSINNDGRMRVHVKISTRHKFKFQRCKGSLQKRSVDDCESIRKTKKEQWT